MASEGILISVFATNSCARVHKSSNGLSNTMPLITFRPNFAPTRSDVTYPQRD